MASRRPSGAPARYLIDELARHAGTTTRNVRALQAAGIVKPPRLTGRTGHFDDEDLQVLRATIALQSRGHSRRGIAELMTAWADGSTLADLLGLPARQPATRRERQGAGEEWDSTFEQFGESTTRLVLVPGFLDAAEPGAATASVSGRASRRSS